MGEMVPNGQLTRLTLEGFKNFRKASLDVGPFTLVVGTNASGKSNLRDALRFVHGIARGYNLAEIIGEKWVEGGVLQWRGIRGGTREATYRGAPTFALEVGLKILDKQVSRDTTYRIEVDVGTGDRPPRVVAERLVVSGRGQFVFETPPEGRPAEASDPLHLPVRLRKEQRGFVGPTVPFLADRPVLSQIPDRNDLKLPAARELAALALRALSDIRFLDLAPDAMRLPSFPGQTVLGDRGENLSSVLQAVCAREDRKRALVEWVRELTPMDARDFDFPADQTGRVLVTLIEKGGQRTSAYSASDGTLRFLAMIAALLGPEPARFYFFEELENGIHPTRLHLLLSLIEKRVAETGIQIVATSHSPQLLGFLGPQSRRSAALVYRLPDTDEAHIQRIMDIPEVEKVLATQDWAKLHASGWLEDAVLLTAAEPQP
jgi:predicted ATPase